MVSVAAPMDADGEKNHALLKQFHVRSIPIEYDDWRVFHCFQKFGIVDSVRLPRGAMDSVKYQYGFVSMMTYEGADAVRAALQGDRELIVGDGIVFKVDNVNASHARIQDKENNGCRGNYRDQRGNRAPFANVSNKNPSKKLVLENAKVNIIKPKIVRRKFHGDEPVKVLAVSAPSNVPLNRPYFYVIVDGSEKDERYLSMCAEMEALILRSQLKKIDMVNAKIDDYVIVRDTTGKPRRAVVVNKAKNTKGNGGIVASVYMVDIGEEMTEVCGGFEMSLDLAVYPALVYECDFAGVTVVKEDASFFKNIRQLLTQICKRAELLVRSVGFVGGYNMVVATSRYVNNESEVEVANIGEGIAAKGPKLTFDASQTLSRYYTRQRFYEILESSSQMPIPTVILEEFRDILRPNLVTDMATLAL